MIQRTEVWLKSNERDRSERTFEELIKEEANKNPSVIVADRSTDERSHGIESHSITHTEDKPRPNKRTKTKIM